MNSLHQRFAVVYEYSVHFTTDVFDPTNSTLVEALGKPKRGPHQILIAIDEGVVRTHPNLLSDIQAFGEHHSELLQLVRAPLLLPGGETGKNAEDACRTVQNAIHEHGICRQSFVMAIGGGAFLDFVGYAAATAHRGVRLVRLPTTVLSQDDSGVGVKNSVNAFGKKNFLGTFAPPFAVVNDLSFLNSLPQREWIGGISEAVKVALLKDPAFFDYLELHAEDLVARSELVMQHVVHRSAELHLLHIGTGGDPFEITSSRPLDFRHWSAHKLEPLSNFALSHGEAVAIGVALDTTYSFRMGWLPAEDWDRILSLLRRLGFSLSLPHSMFPQGNLSFEVLLRGLDEFREHLGGKLTITVLHGIGQPFEVHQMDATVIRDAWETLQAFAPSSQLSAV